MQEVNLKICDWLKVSGEECHLQGRCVLLVWCMLERFMLKGLCWKVFREMVLRGNDMLERCMLESFLIESVRMLERTGLGKLMVGSTDGCW